MMSEKNKGTKNLADLETLKINAKKQDLANHKLQKQLTKVQK